jgi:hypothetical protein
VGVHRLEPHRYSVRQLHNSAFLVMLASREAAQKFLISTEIKTAQPLETARLLGWTRVVGKQDNLNNRREDHETSMLALHLIQNCMVYVNTLMLQEILAQPHWQGRLTATDLRALTPLIWEHVNPYGRFDLDMTTRLPLS